MLSEVSIPVLGWCVLALTLGGLVKGVIGVGFPMIAVPMMSLVIPPHYAAALVLVPVIPANMLQARAGKPLQVKLMRFWSLMLAISIGVFISGWWITQADVRVVQATVGIIIAGYAVQRSTHPSWAIPRAHERTTGVVAGGLAGAIGGMAMLAGPIVVMYMTALRLPREEFVGSIAVIYLGMVVAIWAALATYTSLTSQMLVGSVAACVPVFAGMVLGARIRQSISQNLFERLLTVLLFAIAASLLWRAAQ